jgi:hypothetical protein
MDRPNRRPSNKAIRRRSRRQELELAQDTGGRVQKGSGSLPWAKGDVVHKGRFRAECKQTRARSFVVTRSILDKIRSESAFDETPLLDIVFLGPGGKTEDRFVVMPYSAWLLLQKG